MPNIEIYGLSRENWTCRSIKTIIFDSLSADDLKSVVFTLHQSSVEDVGGSDAPFVRISDTNKKRAERIAKLFENVIDVEILILTKFIPKK